MGSNPSEIARQEGGRFVCPRCGAAHDRGPVNGLDVFRCLNCGETTRRGPPSLTESLAALRAAGGDGWDKVANPEALLAEFRGEPHRCDVPPPPVGCASCGRLWAEVNQLRAAVVEHHAQKADDRCWLDDRKLYEVAGLPTEGYDQVGSPSEMLKNCEQFVTMRCSGGGPWKSYRELEEENAKLRALVDGLHYDDGDLKISGRLLLQEIQRLRQALTRIAEQTPGLWKTDRQIAKDSLAGEGKR